MKELGNKIMVGHALRLIESLFLVVQPTRSDPLCPFWPKEYSVSLWQCQIIKHISKILLNGQERLKHVGKLLNFEFGCSNFFMETLCLSDI